MNEKLKELKKVVERTSDKDLTVMLMSEIMKTMSPETFTIGRLIVALGVATQKLIEDKVITEERGMRIASSAAIVVNDFFKQRKEMNN